jgi:hypothetical protein
MSAAIPMQAGSAPRLAFDVRGAAAEPYAAVPTLQFELAIEAGADQAIRSVLLDVQIQIAARRRAYGEGAQDRLFELFGGAERWASTLRTLPWTRTTVVVPPFTGSTVVRLPVVCTYDLEVVAARYLQALEGGDVPLEFLFSGTVFYSDAGGRLQTSRIALDSEAGYRMPVALWRETMDRYFPASAWLRLGKDSFDRLVAYKSRNALATWDEVVAALLAEDA